MKPRTIWWLYWLGVVAAAVIVGTMSVKLVVFEARHRADLAEQESQRRLDLALFRMEAQLSPVLASENTRPYYHYRPQFAAEAPHSAYLPNTTADAKGKMQQSPLAAKTPPFVNRHFEIGPQQQFSCVTVGTESLPQQQAAVAVGNFTELMACTPPAASAAGTGPGASWGSLASMAQAPQVAREWQIRSVSRLQQAIAQKTGSRVQTSEVRIAEGVMVPVWLDGELLYARQVDVAGQVWLQGAVLDWEALEQALRRGIEDLLPNARLEPLPRSEGVLDNARLAALPVRVIPGAPVMVGHSPDGTWSSWLTFAWNWCPILWPLWGAGLVLAIGVALLLRQMIALDERRAAFVSAVTHELRTPLTTFRMYVEMQRAGMVEGQDKLDDYMRVLDEESSRLVHLVENVLAYARLDQGRASARLQTGTVAELMAEALPPAEAHVTREGLKLTVAVNDDQASVTTDPGAVSQILFNLVDNACKYGRADHAPAIELLVEKAASHLEFRVRDYGPGVPGGFAKRLFEPFSRAGEAASGEAPGVGLGLALCRRLARSLGGELLYEDASPGAAFVLRLPVVT